LKNNTIKDLSAYPFVQEGFSFPVFENNTLENNSYQSIAVKGSIDSGSTTIEAEWGDFTGLSYPYTIVEDVTISKNLQMTIQPGTVIKFEYQSSSVNKRCLIVLGSLKAKGTVDNPIVFTSSRDDGHGGDSNNDQASTLPNLGDWGYVKLSSNKEENALQNCILKYGGFRRDKIGNSSYDNNFLLWLPNSKLEIDNCTLAKSYGGVIEITGTSDISIANSNLVRSNGVAINNSSSNTVSAINNYWGHYSGPLSNEENPDGEGLEVSNNVNFSPWLNRPTNFLFGDFDISGKVDGIDLSILGRSFGIEAGEENWNYDCDLYESGRIDGFDLALFATKFGNYSFKSSSVSSKPQLDFQIISSEDNKVRVTIDYDELKSFRSAAYSIEFPLSFNLIQCSFLKEKQGNTNMYYQNDNSIIIGSTSLNNTNLEGGTNVELLFSCNNNHIENDSIYLYEASAFQSSGKEYKIPNQSLSLNRKNKDSFNERIYDETEIIMYSRNPCNLDGNTVFKVGLVDKAEIKLVIYDLLGKAILRKEYFFNSGSHNIEFENKLLKQSGVYIVHIFNEKNRNSYKLVVL
uniref:T9SS type A sorting domain-containing protein n=1 Tax=Marinifilum flexuosum TaxID=1117708 RepID=UPI00249224BE